MHSTQTKIKVLECIRQGSIGGGESHLLSLSENIDRSTFEPITLSMTGGPMIDKLRKLDIKTYIVESKKAFDFSAWRQIKKIAIENNIDLIHCHGTRSVSNLLYTALTLNIPLIYTIHGWSFHQDQKPVKRYLRILAERFLTSKSTANISVSESNKKTGLKHIASLKSFVISNGIDLHKFNPDNEFKNIKKELGIQNDKILILFLARFTSHKQPLTLLRSFKRILEKRNDLHLLMVGDGDEKPLAETIVSENGLSNNVHLLPFREDVPDLLASSDIFVLPSLWEGMPIGLLEAMSMGKAVIATDVDGSNEILVNEVNGLLIDTSDLENSLITSIDRLSQDRFLRNNLGEMARKTIKGNFSAADMTKKIENIYLDVYSQIKTKYGV